MTLAIPGPMRFQALTQSRASGDIRVLPVGAGDEIALTDTAISFFNAIMSGGHPLVVVAASGTDASGEAVQVEQACVEMGVLANGDLSYHPDLSPAMAAIIEKPRKYIEAPFAYDN